MDNLTPREMLNSKLSKNLEQKAAKNNILTWYLDMYKDKVYLVSLDEKVKMVTEDREKAFSYFESK